MKAWLLRWLDAVPMSKYNALLNTIELQLQQNERMLREHQTAIAELIQELNALRNSIPVPVTQDTKPGVRVFRNFRDFRAVMERRPENPIKIERTS